MPDRLMGSLALVTGTSSGIGEAVARELLQRGWQVVGMARRDAAIGDPRYRHLRLDLGDLASLQATLDSQVKPLAADPAVRRLGLVNNAALVGLLGPVARLDAAELLSVFAVNSAAPVLLMGWFERQAGPGRPLRIVNLSSGAARAAYGGLGAYATSKAALRMAGMVFAAELETAPDRGGGTTILSYEPGVVDTPMQAAARSMPEETLPSRPMFQGFEANNALVAPELPAREIADYLDSDGHPRWSEARLRGG